MKAKIIEWQPLFGNLFLGIAKTRNIAELDLLDMLIHKKIVLWEQVKHLPTAGKIVPRKDNKLGIALPAKFDGIILRAVPHENNDAEITYIGNNFYRIGNCELLNMALEIELFEERILALYQLGKLVYQYFACDAEMNRKHLHMVERDNLWVFGNRGTEVNRRLIIGDGFSNGNPHKVRGYAIIENGNLLNTTPPWIGELFETFVPIPDSFFDGWMGITGRLRPVRQVFNDNIWRPNMIAKYIVKIGGGKLAKTVPLMFSRYCVLPDFTAVEFSKDIEIIDDKALGNTLFLSLTNYGKYQESCKHVLLAEFKD
ncbi:MAG TPA: hypothetical protein ENN07_03440 [candidate division Zixibacteria bacterium]|nr:hypothetical protein [candidate division Zixibacteria bacterium]